MSPPQKIRLTPAARNTDKASCTGSGAACKSLINPIRVDISVSTGWDDLILHHRLFQFTDQKAARVYAFHQVGSERQGCLVEAGRNQRPCQRAGDKSPRAMPGGEKQPRQVAGRRVAVGGPAMPKEGLQQTRFEARRLSPARFQPMSFSAKKP